MIFTEDSVKLRNHLLRKIPNEKLNELKNLFNFFKSIPLNKIIVQSFYTTKFKSHKIKSVYASDVVQNETKKLLEKSCLVVLVNNISFQINIYSSGEPLSPFITNLLVYLQFITKLAKIDITSVSLNYYLIDQNKVFKGELSKDEINSGSCQRFPTDAIVTIWRKEEILKVTLHELIHAFSFDYQDEGDLKEHYNKKYLLGDSNINSYEAYTEIWAELINCYLISQYVEQSKQYKFFHTMILLEKTFSDFQSDKIFKHTDLTTKQIDINKETNVLAYYIIKNELYKSLNVFLKFCRENNEDYIKIIDLEKYQLFLKKRKKDKENKRTLQNINNQYLLNTMRMSLNEMNVF